MPALELMTWVSTQKRWLKWYRGKTYAVSIRQLGTEPTKDASRQAANEWWTKKQTELDAQLGAAKKHSPPIIREYESAEYNHRLYAKWQRKYGDVELAIKSEAIIDWLHNALKSDNPPFPLQEWQKDPLWEAWQNEQGFGMWIERLNQVLREEKAEQSAPRENTIRAHIDDYLAVRKANAIAKGKLGTHDTLRTRLNTFRNWVASTATVEELSETLWERYFVHLSKQVAAGKLSRATMAGTLGAARAFVRSRWEKRLIELPRNLNSRTLSASIPLKEIVLFTVDEIKQLLGAASERKKLYLLLMLNCGMYPVDIAKLEQSEVDWKAGRIVRQRSKTRERSANVPKVDHLLWRETFDLLKKCRSDHPHLVLLNDNGSPLWSEGETEDGKFNRNNNIRTAYFQLQTKLELTKEQRKPLKSIRKTSASMLENHTEYGRYAEYFLGEAPSSIAARHYIQPSREQFDAAIKWLGQQFGIEPAPSSAPQAATPGETGSSEAASSPLK